MSVNRYKLFVWGSVAITLSLWLASKWFYQDTFDTWVKWPAKTASLTATTLMVWTLVLSIRSRFIENMLGGLDKVYKAHKTVGIWATVAILTHPLMLWVREVQTKGWNWRSFVWLEAGNNYEWGYNVGLVAFYGMVFLVALTLWVKLPYEIWKKTHEWFGAVIILVLLHVVLVEQDVTRYPLLGVWVYSLLILGVGCFLWIRYFYYLFGPRFDYVVDDVELCEGVLEIWCAPGSESRVMGYRSSQYVYVDFEERGEYHPFSIASAPRGDGRFKLGIKELGDYTSGLSGLRPGTKVSVLGPYGKFSEKFLYGKRECIFIGGGIGITPMIGMWDQAVNSYDHGHRRTDSAWTSPLVHLFYSVKNAGEASFDNDIRACVIQSHFHGFEEFAKRGHSYDLYDVSKKGYLTADYIAKQVPDYREAYIFLCGPKRMMDGLITQFQKLGVPRSQIITEDFSMLPSKRIDLGRYLRLRSKKPSSKS